MNQSFYIYSGIGVMSSRILTNVHTMNIGRRKQKKMLLSRNDSVEILIMILMKRSLRKLIPNPKIHSLGVTPKSFSSPSNMLITIRTQNRILIPKAIVLLLQVRDHVTIL